MNLHHLFHALKPYDIIVTQPSGGEHLIGRLWFIKQTVFPGHFFHIRALQYLQKTKLKLLRIHFIYTVKWYSEAFISFIRQSCDKIEMLMHIVSFFNFVNNRWQNIDFHRSVDFPDRNLICRLNTDLKLDQTRTHTIDQRDLFFIQ